jgi:hypothetical protein
MVDVGQGNCGGNLPARGSGGVRTTIVGRGVALPGSDPVQTAASVGS